MELEVVPPGITLSNCISECYISIPILYSSPLNKKNRDRLACLLLFAIKKVNAKISMYGSFHLNYSAGDSKSPAEISIWQSDLYCGAVMRLWELNIQITAGVSDLITRFIMLLQIPQTHSKLPFILKNTPFTHLHRIKYLFMWILLPIIFLKRKWLTLILLFINLLNGTGNLWKIFE